MLKYISMIKKNIANIITVTRIIGTIFLLFFKVLSVPFLIAYIYSGFSDVLDGFLARKLDIQSELGRKLDSISDLFFYTVMMIKIWPYLVQSLPGFMWNIIWMIVGIRVCLYVHNQVKRHELLANHTILNKATGVAMFLLPFMLLSKYFLLYAAMVETIAFIAAIYEIFELNKGDKK